MLEQIRTSLQDAGIAIYATFAWPGNYVLTESAALLPQFVTNLSARGSETVFVFLASLFYWFLVIVAIKLIVAFVRDVLRIIRSHLHSAAYFVSSVMAGIKTTMVCKFREFFHWRKPQTDDQAITIQFDDLEIAILKVALAKGSGFALAAPDIAEKVKLRPAQAQKILDKLHNYKMLEPAIGSTDGFDNYRLTSSGSSFVTIMQRQRAAPRVMSRKQPA